MQPGCADLVSTASRSLPRRRAFTFALKTASPLSALEIIDGPTLKALRQAQDELRVLSVNGKKLRRLVPDRASRGGAKRRATP